MPPTIWDDAPPSARPIRPRYLDGLILPDEPPPGAAPWSGLPPTPGYTEARTAAPLRAQDWEGIVGQTRDVLRGTPGASGYEPSRVTQMVVDNSAGPAGAWGGTVRAAPQGIRAFHGSPHRFDRFSLDRIGTGEGAQAYGHGLYFAGNENVARGYRDTLAGGPQTQNYSIGSSLPLVRRGQTLDYSPRAYDPESIAKAELSERLLMLEPDLRSLPDHAARTAAVRDTVAEIARDPGREPAARAYFNRVVRGLDEGSVPLRFDTTQPGHMYEVNLRTDPSRLLDWDAPLSAQPQAARDAVGRVWNEGDFSRRTGQPQVPPDVLAQTDAGGLVRMMGEADPVEAAARLRGAGIDGIQYLDGGSRAAGEGTRNYVMFDDRLVDVLRRYGLLGMIGGGAAAGAAGSEGPLLGQDTTQ